MMKICLICVEIFAWGKYGGFGRSTRLLGREFAKRGHDVHAVIPRRNGQKPFELLDGIKVHGFETNQPFSTYKIFKEIDADIYHSQEPSFGTYMAQKAMPKKKHLITFRDTRNLFDWWQEFTYPSLNHFQVFSNYLYEDNPFVHAAARNADGCFAAAKFLIPKAKKVYGLKVDPVFLPSPINIPERVNKSETPIVCFIGRFDRRKRPEIFFELAEKFPEVRFEAVGIGRDKIFEQNIINKYRNHPNLHFRGFVDQFSGDQLYDLLGKSWILVNTSIREGLPTSFLEAAANGCAILSEINPDNFSSRFGFHIRDGNFEKGLQELLSNNNWYQLGQDARNNAKMLFSLEESILNHLAAYQVKLNQC